VSAEASAARISVWVSTNRRPVQLARLIDELARQEKPPGILELVIVDNDASGSARAVVEAASVPLQIRYDIQPRKNIAITRNLSVRLAVGEWLAFLDDDELPASDWLRQMVETANRFGADGVLGPALRELPGDAPGWIRAGDFFGRRRFPTGTIVPRNEYRISNALINAHWLRQIEGPFDPDYGLTGGEDGKLLNLLANRGARLVWCDEAVVTESVEPARLTRRWLLMRAYRGGQDYARHTRSGAYGPVRLHTVPLFALRAGAQVMVAAVLAVLVWPLGETLSFRWLSRAYSNVGKLTALANRHYQEYR
jgi:succinoglycan biosynthesis protein ExoM